MVKDQWIDIAPGVRSCYRNGVLHIELYGIKGGIQTSKADGVTIPASYFEELGSPTDNRYLVMRDSLLSNEMGVVIGLSMYAQPGVVDKFVNLETTETKLDLELELARHRGEKLPLTAQQTANALMKLADGEATIDELTAENKAIYNGEAKPKLKH